MSFLKPDEREEKEALRAELADIASWEQDEQPGPHECVGEFRAEFMFAVAAAFLFITGIVVSHNVSEKANAAAVSPLLIWPLFILWIIILLEGLLGVAEAHGDLRSIFKRFLLVALLPPFRITFATAYPNRFVWVPAHGWLEVNKINFERLELRLALPMLGITLMVLPAFAVEWFMQGFLQNHLWFAVSMHGLQGFIWFSFATEFLLMFALAEKKLVYCKLHWINIAIILLPLIAVLRTLRLMRFIRVAKAAKLIRAYRLRSIVARGMRLALVFNLVDRLLERNPEKYLLVLEEKMQEKEAELETLREKAAEVKKTIAKRKAAADAGEAASQVPETGLSYGEGGDRSAAS